MKVHPAPDLSSFPRDASNRVRVGNHDAGTTRPLAAARLRPSVGASPSRAKPNFRSSFTCLYLDTLEAEQDSGDRAISTREIPQARVSPPLPGARERLRRERAVRAAAGAPLDVGSPTHVYPSLHVPPRPEPGAGGPRRAAVLGGHGRAGRRRQGRRRRRRRRPRASVPRPDGVLVSAWVPEGDDRLDDAEGDRRPRRSPAHGANSAPLDRDQLLPRHLRRRGHRGRPDGRRGGTARASASRPRAAATPRSTASPASRLARTSGTTACSTCPRRRRSAAAARRTARRSSPRSRRRSRTAWTSSTSRAAGRRRIRARTSSSTR